MKYKKLLMALAFVLPILVSMINIVPLFYGSDSYFYFNSVLEHTPTNNLYIDTVSNIINIFPIENVPIEVIAAICKMFNAILLGLSSVIILLTAYEYAEHNKIKDKIVSYATVIFMFSFSPVILQRFNFNYFDTDHIILFLYTLMIYAFYTRSKLKSFVLQIFTVSVIGKVWGYGIHILSVFLVFIMFNLMLFFINFIKGKKIKEYGLIEKIMFSLLVSCSLIMTYVFSIVFISGMRLIKSAAFKFTAEMQPNIFFIMIFAYSLLLVMYRLFYLIINKLINNKSMKEVFLLYLITIFGLLSFRFQRLTFFMLVPLLIYYHGTNSNLSFYRDNSELIKFSVIWVIITSLILSALMIGVAEPIYVPNSLSNHSVENITQDYIYSPYEYGYYIEAANDHNVTIVLNGATYGGNNTCDYYGIMCSLNNDIIIPHIYNESKSAYVFGINGSGNAMCDYCGVGG